MKKIFTLPIILFLCSTWSLAQSDCTIENDNDVCTFGTATDAGTWNLIIAEGVELTIDVKAWGAGGGTDAATNKRWGGGGGAYFETTSVTVTSADSPIAITVGAGGTTTGGGTGVGETTFYDIGGLTLVGGGGLGSNTVGVGGMGPGPNDGGNGGNREAGASGNSGGGGGGAGSAAGPGNDGSRGGSVTSNVGGLGGATGGGQGGDTGEVGDDGVFPGGGAGGKGTLAGLPGADGANGQVIVCVTAALPVELVSFKANLKDDQTLLEWKTASEINNEGFEVQKSNDGIAWDVIEFVEGNINASVLNTYTSIDRFPTQGSNYYRLKQMDIDGRSEYSKTVVVDFDRLNDVELFPNPAKDWLTLINGKGEAVIYNAMGQIVKQMTIDANQATIQLDDLLNGQYSLQVLQDDGTLVTRLFSKMD